MIFKLKFRVDYKFGIDSNLKKFQKNKIAVVTKNFDMIYFKFHSRFKSESRTRKSFENAFKY